VGESGGFLPAARLVDDVDKAGMGAEILLHTITAEKI